MSRIYNSRIIYILCLALSYEGSVLVSSDAPLGAASPSFIQFYCSAARYLCNQGVLLHWISNCNWLTLRRISEHDIVILRWWGQYATSRARGYCLNWWAPRLCLGYGQRIQTCSELIGGWDRAWYLQVRKVHPSRWPLVYFWTEVRLRILNVDLIREIRILSEIMRIAILLAKILI
jgi:hypothetical protein